MAYGRAGNDGSPLFQFCYRYRRVGQPRRWWACPPRPGQSPCMRRGQHLRRLWPPVRLAPPTVGAARANAAAVADVHLYHCRFPNAVAVADAHHGRCGRAHPLCRGGSCVSAAAGRHRWAGPQRPQLRPRRQRGSSAGDFPCPSPSVPRPVGVASMLFNFSCACASDGAARAAAQTADDAAVTAKEVAAAVAEAVGTAGAAPPSGAQH